MKISEVAYEYDYIKHTPIGGLNEQRNERDKD